MIFYDGYREQILNAAYERYKNYSAPLFANLLRSEHIPFNVFTPMGYDLQCAKEVFNVVLNGIIKEVTNISIEYAPEPAKNYLNDRTSFDTFVEYIHTDGRKGAMGIEVKYTEGAYSIGKKEAIDIARQDNLYAHHTANSGYFMENCYNKLIEDDYRQMWRNHLLGASMITQGDISHFSYIHLHPKGNVHFYEIIPQYKSMLTNKGLESFNELTFEELFELLGKSYKTKDRAQWVDYLIKRYIF